MKSTASTAKTKKKRETRVQKKLCGATRSEANLHAVATSQRHCNTFGGTNIKPQLDLRGKPIAVVHTPKEVYKALGMHLDAPKDVRRAWRNPAKGPIYDMAKRTRERWVRTGAPIFENVSKAMFGDHWYASHCHITTCRFVSFFR